MKRRNKQNYHETSPSPTQRSKISTGEKSDDNISIPLDLTVEILKKLPAKTLMRFRCVSKQWSSIIDSRRDFIDSIVTRSLTHPPRDTHLIFYHKAKNSQESCSFIFSSTHPQNLEEESVSTPGGLFRYVPGLILCWRKHPCAAAIYNPTTRQSLSLPEMEPMHFGRSHKKWRNIQCNIEDHVPVFLPVCIDGTIYYRAWTYEHVGLTYALMRFDVRSEEFDQVEAPKTLLDSRFTLINYRGKLGLMSCRNGVEIWVMEDAKKKQEWSKIIFYEMKGFVKLCIGGVNAGGEIVFIKYMEPRYQTVNVFYYDPKRNSLKRGSMLKSIDKILSRAVPDHVENTMRL